MTVQQVPFNYLSTQNKAVAFRDYASGETAKDLPRLLQGT